MTDDAKLANLGLPRRIWAVTACLGAVERLDRLHLAIAERFSPGDRLVYLGNYLGGPATVAIIDRLLAFRLWLLARPGMIPTDFIYLRGGQEEIWSKLLQIQFAPNPREVLPWMLDHGGAATLECYGGSAAEGLMAAREGAMAMTKWTNQLRETIRRHDGHQKFMSVLQQAALTERTGAGQLLFVHSGLEPAQSLGKQGDNFWWNAEGFKRIAPPYETFTRIFRGYDPPGQGAKLDDYAVTLYGNTSNGPLLAAAIAPDGNILELIDG